MRNEVERLISNRVYDQHEIFKRLYPVYTGHYSRLRDLISEVKNGDKRPS